MTTLSVNFRYEVLGGHTHVAVFAGKDKDHRAKCGDLVFRNEEWGLFQPVLVAADRTILSAVEVVTTPHREERPEWLTGIEQYQVESR